MKLKKGVILAGLRLEMRPVLIASERIWKQFGRKEGVTITGGLEGTHSAGSLHYYGYALDLRTRYWLKKKKKLAVAKELREALGPDYDVVIHSTHIHAEYNNILELGK